MILVGDIGNTETKICLVNSKKKIIKRITFETKSLNQLADVRLPVTPSLQIKVLKKYYSVVLFQKLIN